MAVPVPSISRCVLNHHNLFYQIQNALAFNRDTCCRLVLCLQLLPFHWLTGTRLSRTTTAWPSMTSVDIVSVEVSGPTTAARANSSGRFATWCRCHKTLCLRWWWWGLISQSVCPWKSQFEDKARANPMVFLRG